MSIEEKAKAYDEALKWMRELYPGLHGTTKEDAERYFPELCESEDERIRKALIQFLNDIKSISESGRTSWAIRKEDAEMCNGFITYLEKQKEKKFDFELIKQAWYMEGYKDRDFETEPRWIIKTGEGGPEYELNPKYGQPLTKMQKPVTFNEPYNSDEYEAVEIGNATCLRQKEQKPIPDWMPKFLDELRSKKNYFDWDEHRNIEGHILAIINWIAPDYFKRKEEQKPTEKQDYSGLTDLEREIHRGFLVAGVENVPVTITKETAQDCLAQMNPTWSEEDENKLNHILEIVHIASGREASVDEKEELESFLKSLHPQPKQEWSEEDEDYMNAIIAIINRETALYPRGGATEDLNNDLISWLQSLRPSWKPSEEQMNALHTYIYNPQYSDTTPLPGSDMRVIDIVKQFYEQLLKNL